MYQLQIYYQTTSHFPLSPNLVTLITLHIQTSIIIQSPSSKPIIVLQTHPWVTLSLPPLNPTQISVQLIIHPPHIIAPQPIYILMLTVVPKPICLLTMLWLIKPSSPTSIITPPQTMKYLYLPPSTVSPSYLSILYPQNDHSFQISPTPQNSSPDHQLPSFHCDSNRLHFTTPSIHPPTTNISSPTLNILASDLNITSSTSSILSPTLNHKPPIMDTTNANDLVYLSL